MLSLNLGSNLIADDGAKYISEIISTFALTHEEIVTRRQLKSTYVPDDGTSSPSQHTVSTAGGGGPERPPTATRSFSKEEKRSGGNAKHNSKDKKKEPNISKLKETGIKRGLYSNSSEEKYCSQVETFLFIKH